MAIEHREYDEVDEHLDKLTKGELVFIPNPLKRVDETYNLLPARYIVVAGATGSGKTSFVDCNFVLSPFMYLRENEIQDVHWEVIYFSLERKSLFKKFKWISWLMYANEGLIYDAEFLLGYKKVKPDAALQRKIKEYKNGILEDLMGYVSLYDGKQKTKTLVSAINTKAKQLGTLYRADDVGVVIDESGMYSHTFDPENKRLTKKKGYEVFIELEHEGQKFTLTHHTHRYFMKHPKTLIYVVLDGMNLLGTKEDIDYASEVVAQARDIYSFSPIIITQQNRAQSNVDRLKMQGSNMGPQMEDTFKTSQIAFDSDLFLALFDPMYFKAYDARGMVGGYQIVSGGMMAPQGFCRFRTLHILKNSFGFAGVRYGMKFLGEVGHFSTLPLPDEEPIALEEVYREIAQGR